jgi:hypothetical protein
MADRSDTRTMPKRIRLSRAKGWRLPENAVNVSRPGKWGNPFVVGKDGDTRECVRLYVLLLGGYTCISGKASVEAQRAVADTVRNCLSELRGKDLACWCPLGTKFCHAEVLLRMANAKNPRKIKVSDWMGPGNMGRWDEAS